MICSNYFKIKIICAYTKSFDKPTNQDSSIISLIVFVIFESVKFGDLFFIETNSVFKSTKSKSTPPSLFEKLLNLSILTLCISVKLGSVIFCLKISS